MRSFLLVIFALISESKQVIAATKKELLLLGKVPADIIFEINSNTLQTNSNLKPINQNPHQTLTFYNNEEATLMLFTEHNKGKKKINTAKFSLEDGPQQEKVVLKGRKHYMIQLHFTKMSTKSVSLIVQSN